MRDQAEELTAEIWAEGYIGIWFGAWEPTDLQEGFFDRSPASQQQLLTEINTRNGLQWRFTGREIGVVRQFYNLPPEDWVCACFGGRIHLGQIIGPPQRGDPAYDRQGQKFKWRPIRRVKGFELAQLPDPYRLVSAAGRGTLFQIQTYRPMMCVLEKSINEGDIWQNVDNMEWDDWLDFLGPDGWESLCLGYLICQHHFVPTGLDIGRTLKDFDVLGANLDTGKKIFAQCKKDRTELPRPPAGFSGFG